MTAIPGRGDVILLSFDPTLGHEQSGFRPVVVLAPEFYNKVSGLCLVCRNNSRQVQAAAVLTYTQRFR